MIADPQLNPAAVELGTFFQQPPDTVWRALTEPDLLARWLLRPSGFAAVVGTNFRFTTPDSPADEIACEVLAVEPCTQLTYSWVYSRAEHPAEWIVEWTIRAQGRGTRLLLTQTGFDISDRRQKMVRNAVERSWKRRVLPKLGAVVHR
ncbi:SRPBCC family protein [Nocardia bovistercoris]|uniref:SRPBCC domain-containing protein n=1 Tax=Nocardia bovistercoris TaxID=2785916 RepID=A0A931I7Q2_9NOCA|nr:SRPBCC domain-containing protein [Nocardia bovistercoris]MBH0776472.1 SRPBCC domain-containing protein [Nocardia bovistercoris]